MKELISIIGDYEVFLRKIFVEIEAEGFDTTDFVQMDHVCYRTHSIDNYSRKKEDLTRVGELLSEVNINGRPISTFRLRVPIKYAGWRIDTIELPAPKPGRVTQEGLEHVEFVLYDSIKDFLKKYPDKTFNLASVDRGVNPEVGFKLPSYGVKFHLLSLPTAVFLEKKLGLVDIL